MAGADDDVILGRPRQTEAHLLFVPGVRLVAVVRGGARQSWIGIRTLFSPARSKAKPNAGAATTPATSRRSWAGRRQSFKTWLWSL